MKGAGHNFGVVTSLEMKIYPRGVDTWYYKTYIWTQDKLEAVFEASNAFHNDGNHAGHHLKEMAFNMGSYTMIPSISETEGVIFWSFVYRGSKEEAQPYLDAFDAIEAVSTEDGDVPYPEVPGVSGTGMNSALCDYGLNHVHYPAGLKVWNVTTQRQIYDLYNERIREYPEFQRTTVNMEDYSHEGVDAIDPDTSAYPWRDRGLLRYVLIPAPFSSSPPFITSESLTPNPKLHRRNLRPQPRSRRSRHRMGTRNPRSLERWCPRPSS